MKTAIYIEDGAIQLVITPESEFESNALRSFEDKPTETKIIPGSFYGCQGGFVRHREPSAYQSLHGLDRHNNDDRSLIVRVTNSKNEPGISDH